MATAIKNTSKEKLATELSRSMLELRNYVRQYIQQKIKEHGINITFEMLEVMACLWKKEGVNQQEIADITLRDKSSMTYLLDNLVKRKLVKRVADKNDRRNKLIYLAKEGIVLKKLMNPWVTEVYTKAGGEIATGDLQKTVLILNKMIGNLKKG